MNKITSVILYVLSTLFAQPTIAEFLSGDEIKSIFSGKEAVGDHLKKGVGVKSIHAYDGRYKRELDDGRTKTGKWWVDGDKLCVKFDNQDKKKCRLIEPDGNGGYRKIKAKTGKTVVHYKHLEEW